MKPWNLTLKERAEVRTFKTSQPAKYFPEAQNLNNHIRHLGLMALALTSLLLPPSATAGARIEKTLNLSYSGSRICEVRGGGFAILASNLVLFSYDSAGNQKWSKPIAHNPGVDMLVNMEPTSDQGFVIVARLADIGYQIIKTDSLGEVKVHQEFWFEGRITSITQTQDSGFAVVGTVHSGPDGRGLLARLDRTLTLLWTRVFNETPLGVANSIMALPDGGFILGGNIGSNVSLIEHAGLLRVDSLGQSVWFHNFSTETKEAVVSVELTPAGGFLVSGSWYNASSPGEEQVAVVETDSTGIVTDLFTAGTTQLAEWSINARYLDGGKVVLAASGGSGHPWTSTLLKLDATKNVAWSITVPSDMGRESMRIIRLTAGRYALLTGHACHILADEESVP